MLVMLVALSVVRATRFTLVCHPHTYATRLRCAHGTWRYSEKAIYVRISVLPVEDRPRCICRDMQDGMA